MKQCQNRNSKIATSLLAAHQKALTRVHTGHFFPFSWRRGVLVSGVRRMNEVNARRARLVPGW